jgi:hypothetical protein
MSDCNVSCAGKFNSGTHKKPTSVESVEMDADWNDGHVVEPWREMQLSAMAATVVRDTPLGSWPHPRLFPDTETKLAVLFRGRSLPFW